MTLSRPLALAVPLLVLANATAPAQEWTRFRGPNGTGLAPALDIPSTWTADDFAWTADLPGGGHSSPVVWGNRIFLAAADESTQTRFALCLDAETGQQLWSREYPFQLHDRHKFNSFASATPAVDEERVYFCWSTPAEYTLFALDHRGRDVWTHSVGAYDSQHSCGTSPIVYQDLVVLGNDQDGPSSLVAVDRRTGDIRWQVPRKTAKVAYSTPCVYEPPGRSPELIFNSGAHGISGIDPTDGQTLWEINVFDKRSVSSPIVAAGLVFGSCGSGAGGNYVVAVRPGGDSAGAQPELAYKIDDQAPYVPTPLAKDDLVFLWSDNGVVSCRRAATSELLWRHRVGGNFFSSPICAGDVLIGVSTEAEVVLLRAGPEFEELGRNQLGDTLCHATPAVAGGKLLVRTDRHVFAIGK
jgi:outer membrane protein assembly factor BamB